MADRFNYQGTNWEGRDFRVVVSLRVLGQQLTAADPTRYPVDGTVASLPHDQQNPKSDHRPDSRGWVRAIDWGGPDDLRAAQCEALRQSRDERIKYVINKDRMFSSYAAHGYEPFTWRPYSGTPHDHHSHLSTVSTGREQIPDPWHIGAPVEHEHNPMPEDLPRAWADDVWEQWVEASGTDPNTRTWDFYREDLAWVYNRVTKPLEQRLADVEARLEALTPPAEKPHRHKLTNVEGMTGYDIT